MPIRIPEPCTEDWSKMAGTDKGAFCNKCAKEVIDFTAKTPKEIAFETKHLGDEDIMYDDYRYQIDNTYMSGGSNVDDTDYLEEFEYLAPLHIYPNKLPSNFIIFRVDGSGLLDLTKNNFREEILEQMKVVKSFDLTQKSKIGKFLENSYEF